ncbi:MAG: tRNA (cytidine(34)-2'-O)-methyltransferase [Bacilli bacterium]|jgi:tRNA (cytidine/uridine-2'-O-)-methyltransferase
MNRIVLFEPEKPANTGNIIRTCMALDATLTIIGNPTFDLSDKAFKRAEMDYCIGFKIERFLTIDEFLAKHGKEDGYYVTRYSENVYTRFDYSDIACDHWFMFGRESTGIPKDVLKSHYDKTIRIPMAINARSLNLANSVAIVLSEAIRQQGFYNLATTETIKGRDFLKNYPTK